MESAPLDIAQVVRVFNALPKSYVVVDRARVIVAATESFLAATGTARERLLGVDIIVAFPENPDDPTVNGTTVLRNAISNVIESGKLRRFRRNDTTWSSPTVRLRPGTGSRRSCLSSAKMGRWNSSCTARTMSPRRSSPRRREFGFTT